MSQERRSSQESLATSYEGINLFEDALQQYDELEAAFMQVLREKNMSWFGSLIHPAPNDDSVPLLSTSKKPYRDLILANTISVFDLRSYLLSRQSALLSKLCQPSEICWKAFTFLSTFGRRLREVEVREYTDVFGTKMLILLQPSLPQYFIESWTFSSALSVLDQCDSWASSWPEMDTLPLARYNARKGELIELAKSQVRTCAGGKKSHNVEPNTSLIYLVLEKGIYLQNHHSRWRRQHQRSFRICLSLITNLRTISSVSARLFPLSGIRTSSMICTQPLPIAPLTCTRKPGEENSPSKYTVASLLLMCRLATLFNRFGS